MLLLFAFILGYGTSLWLNGISYYYIMRYYPGKKHPSVSYLDMAPFFSFSKRKALSDYLFYTLIEVTTVLYTISVFYFWDGAMERCAALSFGYLLIALSFIDIRTQILPNPLNYLLIITGLLQSYFGVFSTFKEAILGLLIGYGVLWGINTAFYLIRKKHGMGGGDFKLLAGLLAWLSIEQIILILFFAPVLSIVLAVLNAVIRKKDIRDPMPFGPSLSLIGIICLFYGEELLESYLSIYDFLI